MNNTNKTYRIEVVGNTVDTFGLLARTFTCRTDAEDRWISAYLTGQINGTCRIVEVAS